MRQILSYAGSFWAEQELRDSGLSSTIKPEKEAFPAPNF